MTASAYAAVPPPRQVEGRVQGYIELNFGALCNADILSIVSVIRLQSVNGKKESAETRVERCKLTADGRQFPARAGAAG